LISTKLNAIFRRLGFGDVLIKKVRGLFLRSVIKAEKVDLICSHSPRSDIVCEQAVKNMKIPLVMIEHGIYSYYLFTGRDFLLKPLLAATDIIAVSDFSKNQIKSYVAPSANVTTIYNGVDIKAPNSRLEVRKKLGIKENAIAFGLVARGEPKKGWQAAIEAFLKLNEVSNKELHLILVGGSKYVDELKEIHQQHSNIHFIGKVSSPAYYIDAVDVGLMLSMYQTEALSLAAIEFIMLGKPVIATKVGGVTEVIPKGSNTLCKLIDLEQDGTINTSKLKDVMLGFTNEGQNLALDRIQIEPTLEKFSMEKCADAYENFFQRIVNKTKHRLLQQYVDKKSLAANTNKTKQTEAAY
jgi:glycosyltransferase involved in cell wall biosynthesis